MPSKKFIESCEEMENILCEKTMGFLGLCRDGMPYVVPMTYVYVKGKILIHCALTGKKLEYMKANPQVCFAVGWQSDEVCSHPQGARLYRRQRLGR